MSGTESNIRLHGRQRSRHTGYRKRNSKGYTWGATDRPVRNRPHAGARKRRRRCLRRSRLVFLSFSIEEARERRNGNRSDQSQCKHKGRFCPQISSGRRSILSHNFYRVLVNRSTIAQKPPTPSHGNRTMTCKNIGFQRTFCD